MSIRKRLAWELRVLADRIDPEEGFRLMTGLSVTLEKGRGWVLRTDRKGIPLWYRGPDYDRGHTEADRPV